MSDSIPPPPDYDAIELMAWRKNAKDVPARLSDNDKNILKRIGTYIERFGYPEDDVKEKINSDQMFAANFTLEPRRQGFHEKIAGEWIRNLDNVSDFRILPKSGKNAFHISSDGNVLKGIPNATSKSLDFIWKTGKIKVYAMHKYTKEGGGNQDSQYKEMVTLLKRFMECGDRGCILIVIVDGKYYNKQKMEGLLDYTRSRPPKSYAVQIAEVPNILKEYLK